MLQVFIRKQETVQTVKLTLHNRVETLVSRYEEADPSKGPNRPHISSVTINFKERRDKSDQVRRNLWRAPPHLSLFLLLRLVASASPLGPSGAPLVHLCASGKGLLRIGAGVRK